ncbi:MAG: 4-(cytidine 5'-diphospho)-2-C-methyl-D-erythritol kinase [Betaproteobacteria bacterium]|nr:4-(cytidine 5'-diphospho)-2-C-methyl-D-erythritol kinase [Betaproteobacteria bacterium]
MSAFSAAWSGNYPAPAKLNLMLRVVGRRADGYHLLQTVFRFIDYGDTLRFRVRDDGVIARVNDIPGVPADSDLCVRAARLLQRHSGTLLGAEIELEKRLPMGGGLGGGSSDAATTLLVLNHLWRTQVTKAQLLDLAQQLGADVPVFVFGDNAFAEGIGERLQALTLPPAWYVVLCPPVMVPTAAVFSHLDLKRDSEKVKMQGFSEAMQINDLQALVVWLCPEVARHLAWLGEHVQQGRVQMTGSGACVFASFGSEAAAQQVLAALPADMRGFLAQGLPHHPLRDLSGSQAR